MGDRPHDAVIRRVYNQVEKVVDDRLTFVALKDIYTDKSIDWASLNLDAKKLAKPLALKADEMGEIPVDIDEFYTFVTTNSKALSRDPLEQAEAYMEDNKVTELFQAIAACLIYNKPANPGQFLKEKLEDFKLKGELLIDFSELELETMFGLFDITGKGHITAEQTNEALYNLTGVTGIVGREGDNFNPTMPVNKAQFVGHCTSHVEK
eukprot:CAMPEP_0182856640 /NCGR_PEP_ID=MMETSP0034_2-20130328/2564_1 /TAXON_ID=156128 /ORGANISM="Nephroselmis pyriformis, Strain CCMP717" /LENGTH=207 /DNA_ID=CAMNT_0024987755 /DNA_START=84 /DNA_END=704 /DNA_ORIENTATION=+